MKAIWMKGALVALSLLTILLSACVPAQPITPADQTAIAATGLAVANGMLRNVQGSATPGVTAQVPTPFANSTASSPGVPVTGATGPAASATVSAAPMTATLAAPTVAPSATSGSAGPIPNTGATSVAPGGTAAATACGQALNAGAGGRLAKLWINNDTDNSIQFTLNLAAANSLGQCGLMTFGPIKSGKSLKVTVPVNEIGLGDSCYSAWALLATTRPTIVSGSGFCITTPQVWVMNVHSDRLRLVGP